MTKELVIALEKVRADYNAAVERGTGLITAQERVKNTLFNNFEAIYGALRENLEMQEEIDALDAALKEADDALKEREDEAESGIGQSRDTE